MKHYNIFPLRISVAFNGLFNHFPLMFMKFPGIYIINKKAELRRNSMEKTHGHED